MLASQDRLRGAFADFHTFTLVHDLGLEISPHTHVDTIAKEILSQAKDILDSAHCIPGIRSESAELAFQAATNPQLRQTLAEQNVETFTADALAQIINGIK